MDIFPDAIHCFKNVLVIAKSILEFLKVFLKESFVNFFNFKSFNKIIPTIIVVVIESILVEFIHHRMNFLINDDFLDILLNKERILIKSIFNEFCLMVRKRLGVFLDDIDKRIFRAAINIVDGKRFAIDGEGERRLLVAGRNVHSFILDCI